MPPFRHTTYESCPESLVTKGRWDRTNRWLDSLSSCRAAGIDDWIEGLEAAGHLVTSSSGTSGNASFRNTRPRRPSASPRPAPGADRVVDDDA